MTGFECMHEHARLGSLVTTNSSSVVSIMFTSHQCGVILSLPVPCCVQSKFVTPTPPRKGVAVDADRFWSRFVTGFQYICDHARLWSLATQNASSIFSIIFTSPHWSVFLLLPVPLCVRSKFGTPLQKRTFVTRRIQWLLCFGDS